MLLLVGGRVGDSPPLDRASFSDSKEPMASVLQSSQPAPPPGWLTLMEAECQFVARRADDASLEAHAASAGLQARDAWRGRLIMT